MLKTEEIAQEDPEAVREFAKKCDDPLRSKLLEIVDEVNDA
jgi:hypothetical protein